MLRRAARAVVVNDALRTYPNECCGFLFGHVGEDGMVIWRALPARNRRRENRRRRFEISPGDFMKAQSYADDCALRLVGIYHSHPDRPAVPSDHDREQALPNLLYLIVGVRQGDVGDERGWELKADRSGFSEIPVRRQLAPGKD
ncbi:MAG: M67 family metallopeptidase [Acidobacteria bacterium]|nr:M67 family metallopeptidase [Acidobacteriota bacterium]